MVFIDVSGKRLREGERVALGILDATIYTTRLGYGFIGFDKRFNADLTAGKELVASNDDGQIQLTEIIRPNGKRVAAQDVFLQEQIQKIPAHVLVALYQYQQDGGDPAYFLSLYGYAKVRSSGDVTVPGELVREFRRGVPGNPEFNGLARVQVVGSTLSEEQSYHTAWHHLWHRPFAFDGRSLDTVARLLLSGFEPALVTEIEKVYRRASQ